MCKYTSTSELNDILHECLTCLVPGLLLGSRRTFPAVKVSDLAEFPPQPAQIAPPTSLHLAGCDPIIEEIVSSYPAVPAQDQSSEIIFQLRVQSVCIIPRDHPKSLVYLQIILKHLTRTQVDPNIESLKSRWIYNLVISVELMCKSQVDFQDCLNCSPHLFFCQDGISPHPSVALVFTGLAFFFDGNRYCFKQDLLHISKVSFDIKFSQLEDWRKKKYILINPSISRHQDLVTWWVLKRTRYPRANRLAFSETRCKRLDLWNPVNSEKISISTG